MNHGASALGTKKITYKYAQVSFNKDAKVIQWRKGSLSNKWCWNNWVFIDQKEKKKHTQGPWPNPQILYKINSQVIIDLNVECKIMELSGKIIKVKMFSI